MTDHGILMYDLAGNWCEECGRAKSLRLWPGTLTGCKTCNEVITRHRCTKLPAVTDRAPGQEWECPDCDSIWRLEEGPEPCPDCCADCGHEVTARRWVLAEKGDRTGSAPRHEPQPFAPFRNFLAGVGTRAVSPPGSCYHTAGGSMVHVKPGCRC